MYSLVHSTMYATQFYINSFFCVKAQLEATVEDASNAKRFLDRASSELTAKKRELVDSEKQLKDTRQCLKEKVEECEAFEVCA